MGARNDTRERMVAGAASVVSRHGVAGASISKVLQESQGPRGSVQFHFPGGKTEIVADAIRWTGQRVTHVLHAARTQGLSPAEVVAQLCDHYATQLDTSDFEAGCPIGAVAQESHRDPALGPVVTEQVDDWIGALAAIIEDRGTEAVEARRLATACVAAVEGAILVGRVQRSREPLDAVKAMVCKTLS